LKGGVVIQATDEYMSPNFHGAFSPACLEILFALFIIGLAIGLKRLTFPKLATCLIFAHMALSSVRHMPLFAIVSIPAIGELFARVRSISLAENSIPLAGWWKALVAKLKEVGEGFNENEAICQMHIVPIVTVLSLSLIAIFAKDSQILTSDFDPEDKPWFESKIGPGKPAGTLNYLLEHERTHDLKPSEGLNFDNWGGYLYYKVSKLEADSKPDAKQHSPIVQNVFIDDRADFYGEDHYKKYAIVSQVERDYEKVLKDYKINWILFPYNQRLVAVLKQNPEWEDVSHDKASDLFVRKTRL
jgi:hypothetical protein